MNVCSVCMIPESMTLKNSSQRYKLSLPSSVNFNPVEMADQLLKQAQDIFEGQIVSSLQLLQHLDITTL